MDRHNTTAQQSCGTSSEDRQRIARKNHPCTPAAVSMAARHRDQVCLPARGPVTSPRETNYAWRTCGDCSTQHKAKGGRTSAERRMCGITRRRNSEMRNEHTHSQQLGALAVRRQTPMRKGRQGSGETPPGVKTTTVALLCCGQGNAQRQEAMNANHHTTTRSFSHASGSPPPFSSK